jgi:hypothetical protein
MGAEKPGCGKNNLENFKVKKIDFGTLLFHEFSDIYPVK